MADIDREGERGEDQVIDLRAPVPGDPPVAGAQWDGLHGRWERWDAAAERWVVVGDAGDGIDPADENPLPAFLARELRLGDDIAETHHVIDLDRAPRPTQPLPGAQWNEVLARWERWDEAASAWVEVSSDHTASS